jgi:hypothetical protein
MQKSAQKNPGIRGNTPGFNTRLTSNRVGGMPAQGGERVNTEVLE